MTKEQRAASESVMAAVRSMRSAMRDIERLQNSNAPLSDKQRAVLAEFSDVCLSGGDLGIDALSALGAL
jgi:predicted component of type VI protein secretion system